MSYTALYRKFRPDTFAGVIGQEHIVQTLQNQLQTNRVSHAYLFCGTRGTGKTSTAKIFARAINCLSPKNGNPCNVCSLCQSVLENRSVNVIEIDAASNNGVDNIREIREEVKYPPTEGTYKVYIIDEVHMLSAGAFNALLKTLEEPPEHVIFILATTDPQKVPATILSRCQRFDFHRITAEQIAHTLACYMEQEGISIEKEALYYVAKLGDGSMRDALSILDQCTAFYREEVITMEKVQEVVGSVDTHVFFAMTTAVLEKNTLQAMELIEQMMVLGRDISQFVTEWIVHLRNLLVCSAVEEGASLLDVSQEQFMQLKDQSKIISKEELLYLIRTLSQLQGELKYAANERIVLEVAVLKLCSSVVEESIDGILAKMKQLERKIAQGVPVAVPIQTIPPPVPQAPKKRPPALSADRVKAKEQWQEICRDLDDPVLRAKLSGIALEFKEETDENLYLVCDYPALQDMAEKNLSIIQEKIEQYLEKSISLRITTKTSYEDWYHSVYGAPEQFSQEDAEFESLLGSYFPDADFQE